MFKIDVYYKEIIEAYEELRAQQKVDDLRRHSRADLMKECLRRLDKELIEVDMPFLIKMFNSNARFENLKAAIKDAGADKFRPLQDFLQGKTNNPTDNVIDLLALFIDFQPRPFDKWREQNELQNDAGKQVKHNEELADKDTMLERSSNISSVDTGDRSDEPEHTDTNKPKVPQEVSAGSEIIAETLQTAELPKTGGNKTDEKRRIGLFYGKYKFITRLSVATMLIVCVFVAIYFLTPKQCMCWVKDQYIAVDCKDKAQINPVIAISHKLESFKKIMRADTLTLAHANRVWYSKINHEVEFFTGPGHHPTDSDRSLKAATEYILTKYAGKNAVLE